MKSHQHSSHIGAMATKDVKAKEVIVSLSLIADVSKIPTDWVVPKQFLLGLGCPWEPDPWEYSTSGNFHCL